MKIRIHRLNVVTRRKTEVVDFETDVTFIHGPVSMGKSTTARLIDYCLGGELVRTPAVRSEFVAAQLSATVGTFAVELERSADDNNSVRVTWDDGKGEKGAMNAPIDAGSDPIYQGEVFNLSDLIFTFCGVQPVKVRTRKSDPDSPVVRLSIRDMLWYCHLRGEVIDSSFFSMEHPFKQQKSRDVMRFVTGLYSDRLNELDTQIAENVQTQRAKREAVAQIRNFMSQFKLATESEFNHQREALVKELEIAQREKDALEQRHESTTHALDPLRAELRAIAAQSGEAETAIETLEVRIQQQQALRSDLITSKIKAARATQATNLLLNVDFASCPRCGSKVDEARFEDDKICYLCGNTPPERQTDKAVEIASLDKDLDVRIDDLAESVARHQREMTRQKRRLASLNDRRGELDKLLAVEIRRYDTAYTSSIREAEKKVATLTERLAALDKQAQMPSAIKKLEIEAGSLQGMIDNLRSEREQERSRLVDADKNIQAIADCFKETMLAVKFPGVYPEDKILLDPRNWFPYVIHGDQEWSFADAGSGGKKTLFNVCYALAVHRIARSKNLPLPNFLIVDSPTKNITRDENPELVTALYQEIYRVAAETAGGMQFILIDSHLIPPGQEKLSFAQRRMANEEGVTPLFSDYSGP